MNYLIWGTGKRARDMLNEHYNAYFLYHNINGIVDNDKSKAGQEFMGYPIITPEEIGKGVYIYDKILILSTFYEEIKEQLIEEYLVDPKIILDRTSFYKEVVNYFDQEHMLFEKNVAMIRGIEADDDYAISQYFENIKFYNCSCYDKICKNHDYYLMYSIYESETWKKILEFKRQDELYIVENKMRTILSERIAIPKEKILGFGVYASYRAVEKNMCWGNDNPDKTFMIIRVAASDGLATVFRICTECITYAKSKGYIPVVDMMSYENQYLAKEDVGKINAYENYFYQPDGYTMKDIQKSKNIVLYATRWPHNELINKIYPITRKEILFKVEKFIIDYNFRNYNVCGVVYRGTDYTNAKPYNHFIQPTLEQLIEKVKELQKKWKYNLVYLCTEVQETIEKFKEEFGSELIYYPQQRFPADTKKCLSQIKFERDNDSFLRGREYWIVINILARCNSIIAGNCGATECALTLNNNYEHQYIFDLGRYGIDDI